MSRPKPTKKPRTDHTENEGECSGSGAGGARPKPICIIHRVGNPSEKVTLLSDSGDGPGHLKKLQDVCTLRLSQPAGSVHRMPDICSQVPSAYSEERLYGYHRGCYQRFTANLSRLKKSEHQVEEGPSRVRPKRTPSTEKYIFNPECIFCGKDSRKNVKKGRYWTTESLSKFEFGVGDTIIQQAETNKDYDMLRKIKGYDLFACEAQFHNSCRKDYTRQAIWLSSDIDQKMRQSEMETAHKKAFDNVCTTVNEKLITKNSVLKLSDLQSIYINSLQNTTFANPSYRSENLKMKLQKSFGEKISFASTGKFKTSLVYSTSIDVGSLVQLTYQLSNDDKHIDVALGLPHSICTKFKDSAPLRWPPTANDLDIPENLLPADLDNFLQVLLTGERHGIHTTKVNRLVLSLGQDLCRAVTKGRWKLPKHILLTMTLRHMFRSAELITLISRLGHAENYSFSVELETALAIMVQQSSEFLTSQIIKNPSGSSLFHSDFDNFDKFTASGSVHTAHGIMLQEVDASETGPATPGEPSLAQNVATLQRSKQRSLDISFDVNDMPECYVTKRKSPAFDISTWTCPTERYAQQKAICTEMTETLLLLSGQTVILTSDEAESLVQNGAAAIRGINNHGSTSLQGADSKDIFVPITATACNISQSSNIQITSPLESHGIQSNFVQVKVDGKEIPGFVLDGSGNTASGQDSVDQQNSYGLLTSDKHSNATVVTTEANDTISSTEFLQLNGSPATNAISKSSSYNGSNKESFGRQVYPLSSGGDLMHTQVEQPSVVSELGGIHSIVKLPLVTNDVQNVEQNNKVPSVNSDKQPDSGHRIVAIIHGDDGSSQSIEIPVDGEAYQFNVPHIMTQEITDSQQLTESHKKLEETSIPDQGIADNTSQIFKLSCNDESLQSKLPNNTSFFIGDSGEKVIINIANSEEVSNKNNEVGLEPIFIIPDYSTDNNIPTIQIRNAESDNTVSGLRNDRISLKASPVIPSTEAMHFTRTVPEKRPAAKSLLFPNSNRSEDKLSKMLRFQNPNKNSNTSQTKHGDWKKVMTKVRSVPKVPGSKYLRNIAKKTKFQNLASLLDTKQCEAGSLLLKESAPVATSQVNESIVRAVVAESGTFTRTCEGSLMQNTSHVISGSPLNNVKEEALPSHLSPWNSSIMSPAVNISHEPVIKEEKPLTIRISTGSIYESDAATRGDMAFSPIPSIKCEGNDGPAENSPPLTSIVYFSSEGDEPPQILQLPTGDSTKPLGSKENPIQLVQQGNTFQALQPVHKEQLEQITSLLQQRRLTVPLTAHHDEIYDPKTNMKIVYKVVHPESFREESGISEDSDDAVESIATVPKKRKRGRPSVKSKMTKIESTSELEDVKVDVLEPEEETKLKVSRTRSGRISRPPQHKLTDFKHLLHAGSKDTYLEYKIQEEDPKQPEQVFYSLELTRKKRKVGNETLRLRYSCHTCKKIFVGRIERHYEKFPNHRRDPSLPEDNPNQSYSAIKALSDSKDEGVGKPVLSPTPGTQASEMNGEPSLPIETSATVLEGRENGLLPDKPQSKPSSESSQESKSVQNESFGLGDALPNFEPISQTAPPNSRNKRGRGKGRRRGRGSWARSSSSAPTQQVVTESVKVEPKATPVLPLPSPSPLPPPAPSNSLEQILCSYSTRDIVNAVTKHLCESLTPWKFLCALADQRSPDSSIHQWQERLDTLHTLLSHCKEECKTMLDQTSSIEASDSSRCVDCSKKKKRNDLLNKKSKEKIEPQDVNILSFEDLIKDAVSPVKPEVLDHIQVYDDVANALGMSGGCYTLKPQENRLPTSVASLLDSCTRPSNMNDSLHLTGADSLVSGSCPVPTVSGSCLIDSRFNSTKAETTMCMSDHNSKHSIGVKQNEIESEKQMITNNANTEKSLIDKSSFAAMSKVEDCCEVPSFNTSDFSGKSNEPMDVSSNDLITSSASNLHLSSFSVSSESSVIPHNHLQTPGLSSSSLLTTCDVSTLTTSLSSSSISMLLNNEALMNGTTSTMSISAPCVTPAPAVSSASSSLSLEVPHFPSGTNNSENPMSGCMTMSNVDNSMMNMSSIPQVNPMQQIPIADLDITAEDLPRLLSEGMGMVVGSGGDNTGDGCDAPKLLDTSGDTTDLSEMLFKLQEATVGISQNQDPSVYTGQMMPSSSVQQMNVHSGQLITSQSLSTPPGSGLTSQGYNEMGQTINHHLPPNMGGKSMPMQNSSGSPAPLLTFTGALSTNSDYCSVSQSINQQPINSIGDIKGHEDLIGPAASDPCDPLGKNNAGLVDRDTMNLNFPVSSLSNSELEDILKR